MDTLRPYLWLIQIAAVVLSMAAAVWWWNSHNAAQQQIGYDRAMSEVAEERQRKKDAAQESIDQEATHAQDEIKRIESERDAARRAAVGLRAQLTEATRIGRIACASGAGEGEQGADPLRVLAELLVRADERAEAVGGYADWLRASGLACERSYDAVRQAHSDQTGNR